MAEAGDWRGRAHRFAEEHLAGAAEAIDRDDRIPADLLGRLASAGFLGLEIPESLGGRGGRSVDTAAVLEELARASPAVATMVAVHLAVCAAPIAQHGTPAQHQEYLRPLAEGRVLGAFALTEASAGSDAAHLACRYAAIDGGYRLDGAKMFITDADLAGVILAFATRDPSLGARGISAFVVTPGVPGFSVAQRLDKLGLHGSTTTEVVFQGARLPAGARLGPEGEGFRIAMEALAGGRIGIAACALGTARAAFEGLEAAIQLHPSDAARAELARGFVGLEAAAALVREAAEARDRTEPFVPKASAAKLAASRLAVDLAGRAFEVAGAEAARSGSRWDRVWRDARVFPIVEGTTEIQELILGRSLLGR